MARFGLIPCVLRSLHFLRVVILSDGQTSHPILCGPRKAQTRGTPLRRIFQAMTILISGSENAHKGVKRWI